jgi:hypothetical protein
MFMSFIATCIALPITPSQPLTLSRFVFDSDHASPIFLHRIRLAVQLLIGGSCSSFCFVLVLEQERKLLQCSTAGLRPQEIDNDDLEHQEADVRQQILPLRILHADRVDESVEESSAASEQLEESDTTGTGSVRVQLDEESVGQSVVTHVVAGGICEHPEDDETADCCILGGKISLLSDGPTGVNAEQRACAQEVHPPSPETLDNQRQADSVDKIPACETNIQFAFDLGICESDLGENSIEVVRNQRIARPLREEAEQAANEKTAPHTRRANHVGP